MYPSIFSVVSYLPPGLPFCSLLFFSISIVSWGPFVWRLLRAKHPFIQLTLFRNQRYVRILGFLFVFTFVSSTVSFVTPLYLSEVYLAGPSEIGLLILPATIITALLGVVGGKIVDCFVAPVLYRIAATLLLFLFPYHYFGLPQELGCGIAHFWRPGNLLPHYGAL